MAKNTDPNLALTNLAGRTRTLDDWVTMVHMVLVVLPDRPEAKAWVPIGNRIFATFGDADCRVAFLVPSTAGVARKILDGAESKAMVFVDPDKVHQVIANLVANSIRYTPDGGSIRVTIDLPSEQQVAGSWARVRVKDDGVGIPDAELPKIFEPFSDVHSAKHHTSTGPDSAGLGLYIARGLVDLHGGIITVDSVEGEYTEFTVLLPIAVG